MKKKIIVTGASGFVGQHFVPYCSSQFEIKKISLQKTKVEDVDFTGVESIVHLAGIAHRMDQPEGQIYFDVNSTLAKNFALKAKESGVAQFIYISSVKVYLQGADDEFFNEQSICEPDDDYGKSKLEGEKGVLSLNDNSFSVAVVRPPMVYGAGVKGNMIRLIELVNKGYPLPFKDMKNLRSLVYVNNLSALIAEIINQKASGVFIAGDEKPVSTSTMIEYIYKGLDKTHFWFKLPAFLQQIIGIVKPSLAKRLFGSFIIDNSGTNQKLQFKPPFTTEEGILKMVDWYNSSIREKND